VERKFFTVADLNSVCVVNGAIDGSQLLDAWHVVPQVPREWGFQESMAVLQDKLGMSLSNCRYMPMDLKI